jgi:hypothetical protein
MNETPPADLWHLMCAHLDGKPPRPPSLAEWLMQASPGDTLILPCDTPTQKSNVQSRLSPIARTRALTAASAEQWLRFEWTVEGSVAAWAAVAGGAAAALMDQATGSDVAAASGPGLVEERCLRQRRLHRSQVPYTAPMQPKPSNGAGYERFVGGVGEQRSAKFANDFGESERGQRMGGIGSGRRSGKRCIEDLYPLDIRKISRVGLLTPGRSSSWQWSRRGEAAGAISLEMEVDQVVLEYRSRSPRHNGGEWASMRYAVQLDWTPSAMGGRRVWWRCPALGCDRRAAILFGGPIFACRRCHGLAYRCQRESDDQRATRRADTIRRRLGWPPGIFHGVGPKPKGMHWRTFVRLRAEYDAHAADALAGLGAQLGLIHERLGQIGADMDRRRLR